jgi:hypothetical protein
MRKLQLTVSLSRGALPAIVLATLVPAAAATCSGTVETQHGTASVGGTGGAASSTSSASGGSGGQLVTSSTTASTGGMDGGPLCPPGALVHTFVVDVPPPGVPADIGQICAVTVDPVQSNKAAQVTLTKYSTAKELAMGFVAVDPALLPDVVGLPTISVASAEDPELAGMQVSNIQPTAGGFSFHAEWPTPFDPGPQSWVDFTVKTAMVLKCDPSGTTTRLVEALTIIHLCAEAGQDVMWVSSGSECNACDIIAEMAPSPIVPDKGGDDLPLGRAVRLRIVPLARVGRALVLLAENDGGEGLAYTWQPTGGRVEALSDDIVVWTPPEDPGPHLLQAAVHGDDGAAVASFAWPDELPGSMSSAGRGKRPAAVTEAT